VVVAVLNMSGKASCHAGSVGTDEEDPIMTIPPDLEAQILRYYHVEKWRIGTIARYRPLLRRLLPHAFSRRTGSTNKSSRHVLGGGPTNQVPTRPVHNGRMTTL
jgi:hypothetical protein